MTPEQFKKARGGLSQERFAALLGIDQSTVSKYERGEWPVSKTVEKLIEAIQKEL